MRKKDIFSIITNPIRRIIIMRLYEAKKAAYSDLLDSIEHIQHLTSTGNFNYHINFLCEKEIIKKDGIVYKLTKNGIEIARFVIDIDQKWLKLAKILRGEKMSIINLAEKFEAETGVFLEKELTDFKGTEMIMDENKILGLVTNISQIKFLENYHEIDYQKFSLKKHKTKKDNKALTLLSHPDISYYLSLRYFGLIQDFIEKNFGELSVLVNKKEVAPFLIKSKKENCYFIIAPSILEK